MADKKAYEGETEGEVEARYRKIEELEEKRSEFEEFASALIPVVEGERDIHLRELFVDIDRVAREHFSEDVPQDLALLIEQAKMNQAQVSISWEKFKQSMYNLVARSTREMKKVEKAIQELE